MEDRITALSGEPVDRTRVARHGELLRLIGELAKDPPQEVMAAKLLRELRGARAFDRLHVAATEMAERGLVVPLSNRMRIQALAEFEQFDEALHEIRRTRETHSLNKSELLELTGIEGRIHKQIFIGSNKSDTAALRAAIGAYGEGWTLSDHTSGWHGASLAALVWLALNRQVALPHSVELSTLAQEVKHAALVEKADGNPWADASFGEACLALGEFDEALRAFDSYVKKGLDVFSLGGTRRQLREIWMVDGNDQTQLQVVCDRLTLSLLESPNGHVEFAEEELSTLGQRLQSKGYQGVFGANPVTVSWAQRLADMARCVGRVERRGAVPEAHGTGFVMAAGLLSPEWAKYERVFITNEHVASPNGNSELDPAQAAVRFSQAEPTRAFSLGPVLWSSLHDAYDVTIFRLDDGPKDVMQLQEFARSSDLLDKGKTGKFNAVTVMGHPRGSEMLHLAIENLDVSILHRESGGGPERVWYQSSTLPGNSGSPVLTWRRLEAVAVHHREIADHKCNEGVTLESIAKAISA